MHVRARSWVLWFLAAGRETDLLLCSAGAAKSALGRILGLDCAGNWSELGIEEPEEFLGSDGASEQETLAIKDLLIGREVMSLLLGFNTFHNHAKILRARQRHHLRQNRY